MTTKLQTIDEIMEGREPGSVKVCRTGWNLDDNFSPYFRDEYGIWWGKWQSGNRGAIVGDTADYEIVRHKTAYYQWLVWQTGYLPRVTTQMYPDETSVRRHYSAEVYSGIRRIDHTRVEIEEE